MKPQFKFAFGACPFCGAVKRRRIGRPRNWRLMPLGRSFSCQRCHSQFIDLFLVSLLVERGFTPFYVPESDLDSTAHSD